MITPDDPTLSPEFHSLQRRLAQWRARRPHARAPIPEPLWTEAVGLARRHGIGVTARALRLGHDSLKTRVGRAPSGTPAPATAFVELPIVAPPGTATWILEFQGRGGEVLRVQTPPWPVADLVTLARRVWSAA